MKFGVWLQYSNHASAETNDLTETKEMQAGNQSRLYLDNYKIFVNEVIGTVQKCSQLYLKIEEGVGSGLGHIR